MSKFNPYVLISVPVICLLLALLNGSCTKDSVSRSKLQNSVHPANGLEAEDSAATVLTGRTSHETFEVKTIEDLGDLPQTVSKVWIELSVLFDSECASKLVVCRQLQEITFSRVSVDDEAMQVLRGLPRLEAIEFILCPISWDTLMHLATHRSLTWITITGCAMTVPTDAGQVNFPVLYHLDLTGNAWVTDNVVANIRAPQCRRLILSRCDVGTAVDFRAQFEWLEHVDLTGTRINDDSVRQLAHLRRLRRLDLSDCRSITSNVVKLLAGAGQLEDLGIGGSKAGSEELGASDWRFPQLKSLRMTNCGWLDDTALAHISSLSGLETLAIGGTRLVTDAGLRALTQLDQLKTLTLLEISEITHIGVTLIFEMESLEEIGILGCSGVSKDEVTLLRLRFPAVDVLHS